MFLDLFPSVRFRCNADQCLFYNIEEMLVLNLKFSLCLIFENQFYFRICKDIQFMRKQACYSSRKNIILEATGYVRPQPI